MNIKKILQQSVKTFRKNVLSLWLSQLVLFFTSLFFLLFSKGKLGGYLQQMNALQPQLTTALQTADATDPASIAYSSAVVGALDQITGNALLFGTVVVPLGLLVIWVLCQGWFWGSIKEKAIANKGKYLALLAIPSVIIVGITANTLIIPKDITSFFNTFYDSTTRIVITTFIVLYFLTMLYAVLGNQSLQDALRRTCKLAFKKAYIFVPLFVPLFINAISLVWMLAVGVTQQATKDAVYMSSASLVITVVLLLGLGGWYKVLLQKIVDATQ